MLKCTHCGATAPSPADLSILKVFCAYCGNELPLPDLEYRINFRRREEAAAWDRRRYEEMQEERKKQKVEEKKEESKSRLSWVFHRLWILFFALLGPSIVGWQLLDINGRFFSSDGHERLDPIVSQLGNLGCNARISPRTVYSNNEPVVQIISLESAACMRIFAAGSPGKKSLEIQFFGPTGNEIKKSNKGTDVQLAYCVKESGIFRYQITPGLLDKGKISYAVYQCPKSAANQ